MTKYKHTDTKFDPTAPLRVDFVKLRWLVDDSPDVSWLEQDYKDVSPQDHAEYRQQDKDRLNAFHRGEWEMKGCLAVAYVSYPIGQGSRRLEEFSSGGLWGIESDSNADYFRETEDGQLDDLAGHLKQFGMDYTAQQLRELIP